MFLWILLLLVLVWVWRWWSVFVVSCGGFGCYVGCPLIGLLLLCAYFFGLVLLGVVARMCVVYLCSLL